MLYVMPDVTIMPFGARTPEIAADVFIASGARLIGDLKIAAEASIWFNTVIRADVHSIRIGRQTNVQDNTVIHVTAGGHPTLIGDAVTIGHSATIHACTIEDECLIGMGATLLDGALIGSQSLVAAGALVPPGKVYPPRSLIIGSPAVVKRSLSPAEVQEIAASAQHYAALRLQYLVPKQG